MIDLIRKELKPEWPLEEKIHRTREFLQILLLKILYDTEQFKYLAFVGGTALRVLYDLNRFSEDIDFSLIEKKGYSFERLTHRLKSSLAQYNLETDFNIRQVRTVENCMIRFRYVLKELGLSPLKDQKLAIRLEVDTNPPKGWETQLTLISKYFLFSVTHFDLASLYASKLNACFYREYTKGRDFYDLIWYLGRKVKPNFQLLNNGIFQTQGIQAGITEENLAQFLRQRLEQIDFAVVRKDIERFLVDKKELKLLNKDAILSMIQ